MIGIWRPEDDLWYCSSGTVHFIFLGLEFTKYANWPGSPQRCTSLCLPNAGLTSVHVYAQVIARMLWMKSKSLSLSYKHSNPIFSFRGWHCSCVPYPVLQDLFSKYFFRGRNESFHWPVLLYQDDLNVF